MTYPTHQEVNEIFNESEAAKYIDSTSSLAWIHGAAEFKGKIIPDIINDIRKNDLAFLREKCDEEISAIHRLQIGSPDYQNGQLKVLTFVLSLLTECESKLQ